MIDGVVFDKDGTLFDFRKSWGGWAEGFLRAAGRDEAHAAALGRSIGYDLGARAFDANSPVIAGTAADIAEALLPHMPGQSYTQVMQAVNNAAASAEMAEAVPLRPFLAALKARGLKIGLATNDTEVPARAHLAAHGITEFFDFVAGYDSGHGPKPGPGMCAAFARVHGLDPARVVMVGDSLHDLEAGRRAGMRTVAVLTGIAVAEELAPHADAVLRDIGGLPEWLDGLAAA
jgi:phosphoglycolate phosphatase